MHPKRIMLVAGEASGDTLAAELVSAIRQLSALKGQSATPQFFGAGGPKMAAAGVELALDLTPHAVVGVWEVVKKYGQFKAFFNQVLQLAIQRQPHAIIFVDYPGFNLRMAKAIKNYVRAKRGTFNNWNPKVVYYVSPQIWAWHESRVHQIARDVDLMLSIFPFEKAWYAERAPGLRVEFVGHPLVDRFAAAANRAGPAPSQGAPLVLLLPGSRRRELKEHLPALVEAVRQIEAKTPACFRMILPNESLVERARPIVASLPSVHLQAGCLADHLSSACVAVAASGTVTMECALFGVPTVVIYRTSWFTYQLGKKFIKVKHIAMPNLLAGEAVYPELLQRDVAPGKIAAEALALLHDATLRERARAKLSSVIESLGEPGASQRAAQAVLEII